MVNAFRSRFPQAVYMYCTSHIRDNFMKKARSCGLSMQQASKAWDCVRENVSKTNEDNWKQGCRQIIDHFSQHPRPGFRKFAPYVERVLNVVNEHSRMPSLLAGRTDQSGKYDDMLPLDWSNNNAESVNSLLLRKIRHTRTSLPDLIEMFNKLYYEQRTDVRRAMIGKGKYRLPYDQRNLAVRSSHKWESMTEEEREHHVEKLFRGATFVKEKPKKQVVRSADGSFILPPVSTGPKRKPHQTRGSGRLGRTRPRSGQGGGRAAATHKFG